jgi:hypothetical protein
MLLVGGAERWKGSSLMNGKVLDVALIAAVAMARGVRAASLPGTTPWRRQQRAELRR